MKPRHQTADEARVVFCLSIDLMGSTRMGFKRPTQEQDKFNRALVKQIKPHLMSLGLENAVTKFTGDGWLIMTADVQEVAALCCLATIMAVRFQVEMQGILNVNADVSPLRLAVCCGGDVPVELPDGRRDWVGDSARRSTRVADCCRSNEILIDESVRQVVFRDFEASLVNLKKRPKKYRPKRMEEQLTIHHLGPIKSPAVSQSEAPEYYVYTFGALGQLEDASATADTLAVRIGKDARTLVTDEEESRERARRRWNRLVRSLARAVGPDKILEEMRASGVSPDVVTYNTLINLSPSYEAAQGWFKEMRKDQVPPNVVTYSTLLSKDLSGQSADEILAWYLSQPYHPEEPVQAAISAYRKTKQVNQALRLALDYPHLQAARSLIRKHEKEALRYFKSLEERDPSHPNAAYATGVALMELGRTEEARSYLQNALELARPGKRKDSLEKWLTEISS